MNQIAKIIFLLSVGVMASQSLSPFQLVADTPYYGHHYGYLNLHCDGHAWNNQTTIVFYTNGHVLFNSSDHESKFATVFPLHNNRTIQVYAKPNGHNGFADVYCTVNGTKSTNTMTIPYIDWPELEVYPKVKDFNKRNYTLECNGAISPKMDFQIDFSLNGTTIATLDKGKMSTFGSSGLKIYQENDHSIVVYPTQPNHNGTYACSMNFNIAGNPLKNLNSTNWKSY